MLWQPSAAAPRDNRRLAQYIDEQFGDLSRKLDTFQIFQEEYVPVWTHTVSTDPVIGNGTLRALAMRFGGVAMIQMFLLSGNTTTYETTAAPGYWEFSVPWACEQVGKGFVGSAIIRDIDFFWNILAARIEGGESKFSVVSDNRSQRLNKSTPVPWSTSTASQLSVTLFYPVRD